MKKIFHILEHVEAHGGGLPAAVLELAFRQKKIGYEVYIVQTTNNLITKVTGNNKLIHSPQLPMLKILLLVQRMLKKEEPNKSTLHLHGIWSPSCFFFYLLCLKLKIPYIVSFHGKLMPNLLNSDSLLKRWKKLIFTQFIIKRYMKSANKVHAVTDLEAGDLKQKFAFQKNILVIPNYIAQNIIEASNNTDLSLKNKFNNKTIIFMARLDPHKGIEELIKAFTKASFMNHWTLNIYGSDNCNGKYKNQLEQMCKNSTTYNPSSRINFMGLVTGKDKIDAYKNATACFLPTVSEVIALTNIEASLMSNLVYTTKNSGFPLDIGTYEILPDTENITQALKHLNEMPYDEYEGRVHGLKKWSQQSFSDENLDQKWVQLYEI